MPYKKMSQSLRQAHDDSQLELFTSSFFLDQDKKADEWLNPPVYLSNSLLELASILIENVRDLRTDRYKKMNNASPSNGDNLAKGIFEADFQPYRFLILVPSEEKRSWLLNHLALNDVSTFDIEVATPRSLQYALQKTPLPSWRSALLPALCESLSRLSENENSRSFNGSAIQYAKAIEMDIAQRLFSSSAFCKDPSFNQIWQSFSTLFPDLVWNKDRPFEEDDPSYFYRYRAFFLFGMTSLSQSLLDYCLEVMKFGLIGSIYALSPCLHFWSDSKSDEEVKRALDAVKKRDCSHEILKRYEMLLHDRNTLLANLGVMGREFAQEIEERDLFTVPSYLIPRAIAESSPYREYVIVDSISLKESQVNAPKDTKPSLLQKVQSDILLYIPQRVEPDLIDTCDTSIRCSITPTLFQEVERLYSFLRYEAPVKNEQEIGSIIVLVPDISLYREPFDCFFHAEQPLKVQFWDQSSSQILDETKGSMEEWIDLLLQMVRGEPRKGEGEPANAFLSRSSYLMKSFISHPLTLKAIGVRSDDTYQETDQESAFLSLLDRLNLTWHISSEHTYRELLRHGLTVSMKEHICGNFSDVGVRMLEEITGGVEGSHAHGVDYNTMNSLISCIAFLDSLEKIWAMPCNENEMKSIIEWIAAIRSSVNLLVCDYEVLDEVEMDVFETACQLFHGLSDRCSSIKMPLGWFQSSFLRELGRLMKSEVPPIWKAHVIVAERGNFDLVPCEGIALLGVSQDIFPEKSKDHFFSHLELSSPKVPQDITIIDRSLFLESILSPSHWWYVSAHGLNPSESRSALSLFSPLVRDVIRYLDINYKFDNGQLFSESGVKIIKAYASQLFNSLRKKPQRISKEMKLMNNEGDAPPLQQGYEGARVRLVSELVQLGKSPLDLFLEMSLKIKGSQLYMLENHQKKRGGDALFPSQHSITECIRQMLEGKDQASVEKRMALRWPKGIPGMMTRLFCDEEYRALIDSKTEEGEKSHLFHLTLFDHEYTTRRGKEGGSEEIEYIRPIISLTDQEHSFLMGSLKHSSRGQMWLVTAKWEQELFTRFPESLVRLAAYHLYGIGSNICYSLRTKETLFLQIDQEATLRLLHSWSKFYEEAVAFPFPFTYSIVKALVMKLSEMEDEEEKVNYLLHLIEKESEYNTSLRILMPLLSREYIQEHYETWEKVARELYLPFFHLLESKQRERR